MLGAFAASYLFEGGALWLYLYRDVVHWYIFAALAAHLLAGLSFLLLTAPKPRALPGMAFYYPRIAALLTLCMPLLGLFGISMTLFAARVLMHRYGLAQEYREKAYSGREFEIDLPSDITEFLYEEVDIHPITDILDGDDMEKKRGAVNLLRRIGSAEAVGLLRKSLSDTNAEVRFYAHTALTRLEEDYARATDKARFRAERYDSPKAHAELASVYRNYARSGLPEPGMQERSMHLACEHWKAAIARDEGNKDYLIRLAQACIESKNFSEALGIYRDMIADPEFELEARMGICQIFFETGDFRSLFQEVEQLQSRPALQSVDPFKTLMYHFWMEHTLDDTLRVPGHADEAGHAFA